MKKIILSVTALLTSLMVSFAQSGESGVEMATGLRSSGKIYVVVLVMAVLFVGLAIYLFSIDRKVSKLEKERK